jgi:hypothetical protein
MIRLRESHSRPLDPALALPRAPWPAGRAAVKELGSALSNAVLSRLFHGANVGNGEADSFQELLCNHQFYR